MLSAICFNFNQSKILWYGDGLNHFARQFQKYCGKISNSWQEEIVVSLTIFTLQFQTVKFFPPNTLLCLAFLVNSLPNDKILDLSNLKDFAEDKISATYKMNFVVGKVQNMVGKGENAGFQHFLLFLQCFQRVSLSE